MPFRPRSLRQRLMLWLVTPGVAVVLVLLARSYLDIRETADTIQDRLLVALAVSISEHAIGSSGDLLSRDIKLLLEEFTREDTFYHVKGPGGAFVSGYADLPKAPPPADDSTIGMPRFYGATYQGEPVRGVVLQYLVAAPPLEGWMTVHVVQTRRERNALIRSTVIGTAIDFTLVITLGVIFAWIGVTRGLSPLARLQAAIRRRSHDDLRPITHRMPAEVAEVVNALNMLLSRLKSSIHANQRFIAEASHQLRTPLATVQADLEWALRDAESERERKNLGHILEQSRKTSRLASQLLNLARVGPEAREAGGLEPTDLAAVATETTGEFVSRALKAGNDLGYDGPSGGVPMQGSRMMLHEMLSNLIDNTFTYCPAGCIVTVRVKPADPDAGRGPVLEVEDNGPGIPPAERTRAVQRFVRLAEDDTGSGLGLAIVSEIAKGHGAALELTVPASRQGLLVRVTFPAVSSAG